MNTSEKPELDTLVVEQHAKADVPVERWTGKTVMLIGAHADDDSLSHGTLRHSLPHRERLTDLRPNSG